MHFPTAEQGWAVGNDGVILHSNDAGATWSKQLDGREIGALLVQHYGALASAESANEQWSLLVNQGFYQANEALAERIWQSIVELRSQQLR
ncbi:hypothetical protein [Polaromonas sp.]|uniref:hypothetical protein n=1 Tax=Polaromonas sp. TaxID=1869339 RepID=UPI002FCB99CF